ncbi:MAG: hypothetical protein ABI895_16160 [Deltaproteobacteria bacterium]
MSFRQKPTLRTTRARLCSVLAPSACLLLATACGDAEDTGAATNDRASDDEPGVTTTIADPANLLGVSSGIRCSMPPALPRAELRFETRGGSARLPGHLFIATEDEIGLRVVCSNPADLTETLGIQLIMETGSAIGARTYTKELAALAASEAAKGGLELEGFRGNCAFNHSTKGLVIGSLDEGEPHWDHWYGAYDTDRSGRTRVTAGDTTRGQVTWTDAFTAEISGVESLEDMSTPAIIGPNDGIIHYEYHGTLSLAMVSTLLDGKTPDPSRESATVTATF